MLKNNRTASAFSTRFLIRRFSRLCVVIAMLPVVPLAYAVEVLSVHELVSHCEFLDSEPDGADSQYCIRYIQGFIDGAVVTDVSVMLNLETKPNEGETFSERAKRTRMPGHADRIRAARLAGFCLGDPLPLRDVVKLVVADLVELDIGDTPDSPARDAVYQSLKDHYPCPDE